MKDMQIHWKTPKCRIINERCQMKRPNPKSSCYTQSKIDSFLYRTHTAGLAGLVCLSHISSAAECQRFLWLPLFHRSLHISDSFALCSLDCIWLIYSFMSFFCCTAVEQHWIICSEEIIRPFTSIADCTLNATFSVLCLSKMWSKIDYRGSTERPYFMHLSALNSVFLPPHHATALNKRMLTHNLAHSSSLVLVCLLWRSIVATCVPPHPPARPPPPSFWRVGSSELVAVCTAKGNVSSTRRKSGSEHSNAHCTCSVTHGVGAVCADRCVLSDPRPCTWMFLLLTPVLSHLLSMSRNSSCLRSLLLRSS